jgi:uncharacterized protein (DUF58 family)
MKSRFFLISILLLLILAVALAGGFTLLWRFLVFLVVILLFSYLWQRLSIRGIDGKVKNTSDRCQVGKYFEEEFAVSNHGRLPTAMIELQEDTDLPGYHNALALSLFRRDSHSWRTRIFCQRRGQYRLGILKAKITDPLGFFPRYREFGELHEVLVYPRVTNLPFFQVLPRQVPALGLRRWLSSEVGPNAARVREYTSGDSLRHIHWHTTAHTGTLMVRDYDPDRSHYTFKSIWIVLDMHRASQSGEGAETTEEYSIAIAASLAEKYLNTGKSVGLIASGDRPYLFLPGTGDQQRQYIMEALSLLKATGNVSIDTLLTSQTGRFEAGSAIIVIAPSDNQGIATLLRRIADRGTIVTAILLDSLSFGGKSNAATTANSLISSGLHAHVVRRGVDIARALDSRLPSTNIPYIPDRVSK